MVRLPLPSEEIKKLVVKEGLITPEKFDQYYQESERKNQSVIDILVSDKIIGADYLNNMIANALGVPMVDFNVLKLDPNIVKVLPEDVARQREVIIFNKEEDGTFDAAMVDPSDLETRQFLEQRLQGKVRPFLATTEDLNRGFSVYGYELGQDFKKLIEDNIRTSLLSKAKDVSEAAAQLPIVGIVDNIMSYAIASRASDIHIEILEEATFIRYRIDGIMYEIMRVTKAIHSALVARIKLLAGLKIDEHFTPQDGRFRYQIANETIDVRVSVMPTFYGEKVEMRLLEASQKPLSLEDLGFRPDDARKLADNVKKTFGMIIASGPTGSGKTTTLYTLMNMLNRPEVNVTTIEDPVEYNMPYVNQTQINPQAGITFASGLRALLRQDPNIIMVGEIRDAETAEISVQAALTGHLLLSSLHTNDAPTAVPRFFDLNVPPFLMSSVLNLVVAQRLVRKICQSCAYSYEADPNIQNIVENQLKDLNIKIENFKIQKVLYRGKGCSVCGGTGYRGRIGIYEVMEVSEKMRTYIAAPDFGLEKFRELAREGGMRTMFEDGLEKVELALTTLEEVLRVIRE